MMDNFYWILFILVLVSLSIEFIDFATETEIVIISCDDYTVVGNAVKMDLLFGVPVLQCPVAFYEYEPFDKYSIVDCQYIRFPKSCEIDVADSITSPSKSTETDLLIEPVSCDELSCNYSFFIEVD